MTAPPKVYIDGHVGTTGLRIRSWLKHRDDIELITIPEKWRKDSEARKEHMLAADISVWCLPDEAAREAASWLERSQSRVIDASTAHRVDPNWVYGLPEMAADQRQRIAQARRVSNPGCYSSTFILLVRPLVEQGLIDKDSPIAIHALSGYSGGGNKLIDKWEDDPKLRQLGFEAPYALFKQHKHIPEMLRYSGLNTPPQFVPAVGPFRTGMRVQVPIHASLLKGKPQDLQDLFRERYAEHPFVNVVTNKAIDESSLDPQECNDSNSLNIHVLCHEHGHVLLVGILDNLGHGASGLAIQNLNVMLGLDECRGLPKCT